MCDDGISCAVVTTRKTKVAHFIVLIIYLQPQDLRRNQKMVNMI